MPRECRTNGGYIRHCQGERLVAEPDVDARARSERLDLGLRATAQWLLHNAPFDAWLEEVASLEEGRLTFPVTEGYLGRGFGYTRDAGLRHRRHLGVDIGAEEGTPIVAAKDGLVAYSDNGLVGYGNIVILIHRGGYTTLYAHCQRTLVAAGQIVRRGEPIAEVGQTGFANAAHLHFEWRQGGWPRDPRRHFLPKNHDVL
jgi:murein DD-endopeptidase MepM/ murein hydrolase activator NlpD